MPNWCQNHVTVRGSSEQMVELMGAIEQENVCEHYLPLGDYADFATKIWGTKWDLKRIEVLDEHSGTLTIRFDSAWSFPIGLYERLAVLGMTVDAYYIEWGVGFCGMYRQAGNAIVDREYDFDSTESIQEQCPAILELFPSVYF